MIEIYYDHNLQQKIIALGILYRMFWESRKSALSSVGYLLMTAMRDHIEGFPESTHPLTSLYKKKYGKSFSFSKRIFTQPETPFFWLGKFSRYVISGKADQMQMGFGKFKKGDAKKKPVRFDQELQSIGGRVQSGYQVSVTDRMRKKIAASTSVALRKSTTQLIVKERPIDQPVFAEKKAEIFPLFSAKFKESVERKFGKL